MLRLETKDAIGFFRMGLATGLVDKQAVVDWADREIMASRTPGSDVIELSLAGNKSYSQVVWLLGEFEGQPDYGASLGLLLARAGTILEQDPGRAGEIIMGLRLLNAEMYTPQDVKAQLIDLDRDLDQYNQGRLSYAELLERLTSFLAAYSAYRAQLASLV